jgi:transcriptional regulator with XRE-family HTH domain
MQTNEALNGIAQRLRKVRKRRGWSIKYAAEQAQLKGLAISESGLNGYELAVRDAQVSKLIQLANFYGVDPAWLLTGIPSLNPTKYLGMTVAQATNAARADGWVRSVIIMYDEPSMVGIDAGDLQLWLDAENRVTHAIAGPRNIHDVPARYCNQFTGLDSEAAGAKAFKEGWQPVIIELGSILADDITSAGTMALWLNSNDVVCSVGA